MKIPVKYYQDITKGMGVMGWASLCLFMDKQIGRQTDARLITIVSEQIQLEIAAYNSLKTKATSKKTNI